MANTFQDVQNICDKIKQVSDLLKETYYKAKRLLDTNSDYAIEWSAQETPAYITEDEDGNIQGYRFSRTEVSNMIGTLDNLCKLLDNQSVTQGDHLANVNLIADA